MPFDTPTILFITGVLLLAGLVKGVIGFGLPSISMGLLSLVMLPAQAAALLLVPNIVTNIWQSLAGPALGRLLVRLAPLLIGTLLGEALTEWLTGGQDFRWAARLLGLTLAIYALLGLFSIRFAISQPNQQWTGWLAGLATGAVTVMTGVFVIPSGPYLQAVALEKDELVQALGLAFLVASLGLGMVLWLRGGLAPSVAGSSAIALIPALAAMIAGQKLRSVLSDQLFKRLFFTGLLALGALLVLKG